MDSSCSIYKISAENKQKMGVFRRIGSNHFLSAKVMKYKVRVSSPPIQIYFWISVHISVHVKHSTSAIESTQI